MASLSGSEGLLARVHLANPPRGTSGLPSTSAPGSTNCLLATRPHARLARPRPPDQRQANEYVEMRPKPVASRRRRSPGHQNSSTTTRDAASNQVWTPGAVRFRTVPPGHGASQPRVPPHRRSAHSLPRRTHLRCELPPPSRQENLVDHAGIIRPSPPPPPPAPPAGELRRTAFRPIRVDRSGSAPITSQPVSLVNNRSSSNFVASSRVSRSHPTDLLSSKDSWVSGDPLSAKKPPGTAENGAWIGGRQTSSGSLICRECGRCRCEACRNLGSKRVTKKARCWIGGSRNWLLCSPQACIDMCTCALCVKAVYYHCVSGDDPDGDATAHPPRRNLLKSDSTKLEGSKELSGSDLIDSPGSPNLANLEDPGHQTDSSSCCLPCLPPYLTCDGAHPAKCVRNWSLLGLASCLLPCLCCYPPLMCLKHAIDSCCARMNRTGCRCRPPHGTTNPPRPPNRDPDPEFDSGGNPPPPPRGCHDNLGKLLTEDPL